MTTLKYMKTGMSGFYAGLCVVFLSITLCVGLSTFMMFHHDPAQEAQWLKAVSNIQMVRAKTISQDQADAVFAIAETAILNATVRQPLDRELWYHLNYIYAQQGDKNSAKVESAREILEIFANRQP